MSDTDSTHTDEHTSSTESDFTAPYTSFLTVTRLIDRMAEQGGAPSRVDRSYLSTLPGGAQTIFIASCKTLGLIDEDLRPTKALEDLIDATPEERKGLIGQIVEDRYVGPLSLGDRATQAELEEEFRKLNVSGSTMRKAIGFYLNALKFAGIPYSSHFKLPKVQSNGTRKRKAGVKVEPFNPPPPGEYPDDVPAGRSDLPTLVQGLIEKLPADGDGWTAGEAKQWLEIAKLTFPFVYGYEDGGPNP